MPFGHEAELLKSFAVLAETCHFGEASRQLGISQPSLSKQIRRLEDMLGVAVCQRDRHGTSLTAFGRQLLVEVQPMLRQASNPWDRSLRAARGERGRLAIGFTYSGVDVMTRILARFQTLYPEVELSFEDIASRIQAERIAQGTLDLGFARLPVQESLAAIVVAQDRLALAVPVSLAEEITDLDSPALRRLPFFGLRPDLAPGVEAFIQRQFRLRGFQPLALNRVNGSLTSLRSSWPAWVWRWCMSPRSAMSWTGYMVSPSTLCRIPPLLGMQA